jgi:D-alanyl-D-alanine dipeptidase
MSLAGCLKTAGPAVAEPAAAESEPRKESPPPASTETPASDDRYTPVPDTAEPKDGELVKVSDFIPTISVDLKYATADNFTETVIYGFSDAYLRYGTVKKLRAVQKAMLREGFSLKIWDAFRPVEAQYKLWEVCPDPTFVANPNTGYSSHSRGNTLDVTLVNLDGTNVRMPTEFDDFSSSADRNYSDVDEDAAANARLLEKEMTENGFSAYQGEWWHFSDTVIYDVEENFSP